MNGMNSIVNLSVKQLRRAVNIKDKIQSLENRLNQILGSPAKAVTVAVPKRKKRKMSAAGRAKIAAAQKARWAKAKGERRSKHSRKNAR
jgi:2C-methyl-D-erythritol 2,4-cyclodiphosphate synthase